MPVGMRRRGASLFRNRFNPGIRPLSMLHHARQPYARTEAPVRSPRSVEYDALVLATQRLTAAWAGRQTGFADLAAAVDHNTRLWSTLAADVAGPGNGLSPALRAQLFYLFQFAEAHGRKVLSGSASVEALVDINTAVMRGLRGASGEPR